MEQSKSESLLEAIVNSVIAISYAVAFYWYIFGFTFIEGLSTTLLFSVVGLIRVYIIRRVFIFRTKKRKTQ